MFHLVLPWQVFYVWLVFNFWKVLVPLKTCTSYKLGLHKLSSTFIFFHCMFMEFDANFDGITLLSIPVLHFCDATKKHCCLLHSYSTHLEWIELHFVCIGNVPSFELDCSFDAHFCHILTNKSPCVCDRACVL